MKSELKNLKAALAQNDADQAFLASFAARIREADAISNTAYLELQRDPSPERAEAFIKAQTHAEALRIPCARAQEACIESTMSRIAARSKEPLKAALAAAVEVLTGHLEEMDSKDRWRCEQVGLDWAQFCQLSNPLRQRIETDRDGIAGAITAIDTMTANQVPTYAQLALDVLEK